jgi:hypothetical protein
MELNITAEQEQKCGCEEKYMKIKRVDWIHWNGTRITLG